MNGCDAKHEHKSWSDFAAGFAGPGCRSRVPLRFPIYEYQPSHTMVSGARLNGSSYTQGDYVLPPRCSLHIVSSSDRTTIVLRWQDAMDPKGAFLRERSHELQIYFVSQRSIGGISSPTPQLIH
jgi:hypothetical protein